MSNATLIILLAVIVIVAVAAMLFMRKRRTERLRGRFGPEYHRAVEELGDQKRAEAQLEKREKRVAHLPIRPLTPADRSRFTELWRKVQARFVDDPQGATTEADTLLGEVMTLRGYPISDFEQRAADVSVDHPVVVENYRAGHAIALRHARGQASTEDLRQAMIHYRRLFEELVSEPESLRTKVS